MQFSTACSQHLSAAATTIFGCIKRFASVSLLGQRSQTRRVILELNCADLRAGIDDPCGLFQLRIFYDSTLSDLEKYQEASLL